MNSYDEINMLDGAIDRKDRVLVEVDLLLPDVLIELQHVLSKADDPTQKSDIKNLIARVRDVQSLVDDEVN